MTDITGQNEFRFMQVGKTYDCKISIYADTKNEQPNYDVKGKYYKILGYAEISDYQWLKVKDDHKNVFYIDHILEKYKEGDKIYLIPLRYNLLAVDGLERKHLRLSIYILISLDVVSVIMGTSISCPFKEMHKVLALRKNYLFCI